MLRLCCLICFLLFAGACLKSKGSSTTSVASTCSPYDKACLALKYTDGSCTVETTLEQGGLRALSNQELANTLQDAFGIPVEALLSELPRRESSAKFQNSAIRSPLSFDFVEKWQTISMKLAKNYVSQSEFQQRFLPACTEAPDAACLERFVSKTATLLWRRPPSVEVQAVMKKLYDEAVSFEGITPLERLSLVLAAIIQDPQLLYRIEVQRPGEGPFYPLDAYDIASRLSLFIWRSIPDQALLDQAASGALLRREVIMQEASRLLEDPKAERAFKQFVTEWLFLYNIGNLQLPGVSINSEQLREEVYNYTLTTMFRNVGSARQVMGGFPAEQRRLLEFPGVLGGLGVGQTTSPVKRGLFVAGRLLCREIPPPPKTAGIFKAEVLALDVTPRERLALHEREPSCASCHASVDAVGLGLENFDALATPRTMYANGKAIDASGTILLNEKPRPFKDGTELMSLLGESRDVDGCMTVTLAEFAWGASPTSKNSCELSQIYQGAAKDGFSWKSLVRSIIAKPSFLLRTGG